jgi:hypothetical protein
MTSQFRAKARAAWGLSVSILCSLFFTLIDYNYAITTGSSAVTAILERRKFMEDSESSDSDEDDDDWD